MNRQFRRHPRKLKPGEHDDGNQLDDRGMRFGFLWIFLAILVLVIVIAYDRTAIHRAREHMKLGENYVKEELYTEALPEFQQALDNKRLSRRERARVALAMGDVYFQHLDDYPMAYKYYVQARLISPASVDDPAIQKRIKASRDRSEGPGVLVNDTGSTPTVIRKVELISRPIADFQGPVVASYKGGEIHAGALLRYLEKDPRFRDPAFRDNADNVASALNSLVQKTLAYEAATAAGVQRDPDVSTRLFDYQVDLLTGRYMTELKQNAQIVSDDDVQKYYDSHKSYYHRVASISLSMIRADTESSATEALDHLRKGVSFHDVATTYSRDHESAGHHGVVGTILETDDTVPGIGKSPDLVKKLFALPLESVTEVTHLKDGYFIFKITRKTPGRDTTLEEARPQIEQILRGAGSDKIRLGLTKELSDRFAPSISNEAVDQFWAFVDREAAKKNQGDSRSTHSLRTRSTTGSLPVKTSGKVAR